MSNLYRRLAIDATYQFRFRWPIGCRGEEFKEIDQSETRMTCGGKCLLTDRDKMNNLYRGPFIDACYLVSFHFSKRFQSRRI
jgi:hypothetical protein